MSKMFRVGGFTNLSFDLDAAGEYLYIGTANNSNMAEILRLKSDLSTNATSVYNAGVAGRVNIKCGDYDAGVIWALGSFGTTKKIVMNNSQKSYYWYDVDNGYGFTGDAEPFVMGPGNDLDVLVEFQSNDKLYESYWFGEMGPYWFMKGENMPFDIRSIDRLATNPDEVIIGAEESGYWYMVELSQNGGRQFSDISYSLSTLAQEVTSVILV